MFSNRLKKCRRIIDLDTQHIRFKLIKRLEEMFDCAHALSQNKDKALADRERWTKVAAYIAQTINSITAGFDERKIDSELDELERLVDEARAKTQVPKA